MNDTTHTHRYPSSSTIHRQVLSNGVTVLVYENFSTQSVVIEGLVRVGALADPPAQAGLASFTAGTLMRGTQQRSYDHIYEALESVGADLGFSSGYFTTSFSAQSLVEDFGLMLDLLAESLRTPTFPPAQIEQVRAQILTGLQLRASDTAQMAMLAFREKLYGAHPYGRSRQGTMQTVKAITPDAIADFHRRFYGPQGMIFTVVGGIRAADAVTQVVAAFGDWTGPQQPPPAEVADVDRPWSREETAVVIPDKSQADVVLGVPGPRRSAPDYLHASLANTVLGVFGNMGRIGQAVREAEGLAYYAYSRLEGGLGPGPWFAGTGVAPDKVSRAVALILKEIHRLQQELVPADELADSQAYRIGSLPVGLETSSGMADVITDMELYDLGPDYLLEFPERIRAITPQQIQAAARKYLSTEQLVVAVAGP